MIELKIIIFFLTIISVRLIFKYVIDIGDKKIVKMKEFIDFVEYMRIYSCDMKMSLEEILLKYNYKSEQFKGICYRLLEEITNDSVMKSNKKHFLNYIESNAMTPVDFNSAFANIIDYYGNTYSDVLDKKLVFTIEDMTNEMKKYEGIHIGKKDLYNKISVLFGCLAAVILI
nr:hypothetical protein [Sedimentibacter sp.]